MDSPCPYFRQLSRASHIHHSSTEGPQAWWCPRSPFSVTHAFWALRGFSSFQGIELLKVLKVLLKD